jgi:hypothetical protein
MIFFVAELVADSLMVYVLDKRFGVPFLRLPRERDRLTKKYWLELLFIGMIMIVATLTFYFAYETTLGLGAISGDANSTEVRCEFEQQCEFVEVCD